MPVYFVTGVSSALSGPGLVKIGKAADVRKRVAELQVGSPDRLIVLRVLATKSSDYFYHRKFFANRVHGEWFQVTDKLMAFIESLPTSEYDGYSAPVQQRRWAGHGNAKAPKGPMIEQLQKQAGVSSQTARQQFLSQINQMALHAA